MCRLWLGGVNMVDEGIVEMSSKNKIVLSIFVAFIGLLLCAVFFAFIAFKLIIFSYKIFSIGIFFSGLLFLFLCYLAILIAYTMAKYRIWYLEKKTMKSSKVAELSDLNK